MMIQTSPIASGELIYDASRWSSEQAALAFETAPQLHSAERGRGQVRYLKLHFAEAVLRRYRRGGMAARLSADWYLWQGREASRPFREFRLTASLLESGLPVPRPLAARYLRAGLGYHAELITERIADAETLADRIADGRPIGWSALGAMIARFHRHGLWHADLNAHNVMIDSSHRMWLIDLDRCRLRPQAKEWMQRNLDRLQRSLRKLGAGAGAGGFSDSAWAELLAAHQAGVKSV